MPKRAESGFTLLEVLAAVAVLGILYPILMAWAGEGIRNEGVSKRRLEASLIADRRLADLEADFQNGTLPPVGRVQAEQDDYDVVTIVEELELPPEITDDPFAPPNAPPTNPAAAANQNILRRVVVRVFWQESGHQSSVDRVTYAWDPQAAAVLLGETPQLPGNS
jgi:prepilin-type N-terminal cleavage/methylation domain-containing protein